MKRIGMMMVVCLLIGGTAYGQDKELKSSGSPEPVVYDVEYTDMTKQAMKEAMKENVDEVEAQCAIKTTQLIDLNRDFYRWYNNDVDTAFWDPEVPAGYGLTWARLTMEFGDVDFFTAGIFQPPELDVVGFGAEIYGMGPQALDVLEGSNNEWREKTWDVTERLLDNDDVFSVPFGVNVDAAHNSYYWAVYLDYAKLTTCWNPVVVPQPVPLPVEPALR